MMETKTIQITINPNGPAMVECERAEIKMPDGSTVIKEGQVFLCRCGQSQNKPFCDGSHKAHGFEG